ncbi:M14 family metallopeptidase [Paraburkholderia flagellata]|uniref:M14 family metallopeptidase n=1 Tax=Paraburkholderia flagellata TaxID=2883241 RepID=UPI001F3FF295|nr:M14 family metallopeptidase [Paraburkholderia flagellata]
MASLFSTTYSEARARFMGAAAARGLALASHVIPELEGREGEALATDVVRLGPADAKRLLVLTSGTHGVEGFCGSAAQTALLGDAALQVRLAALGVAVLVVHAINPYGFSWLSRTNEDNVDLNRNSIDFAHPVPRNEDYEALHALLVPPQWPPSAGNAEAIASYIASHGEPAYQRALTTGQYHHADGLFYGGDRHVWSTRLLQTLLAQHASQCEQIGWIDFHTGLGPAGHGEKICAGRIDAAELGRARAWWGADVASPLDGTTIASNVGGPIFDTLRTTCPQAQTTAIAIEFGTVPLVPMLHMLRADVWVRCHPAAPEAAGIREQIRATFCFDDALWQGQILGQSRAAILQGVLGLSRMPVEAR